MDVNRLIWNIENFDMILVPNKGGCKLYLGKESKDYVIQAIKEKREREKENK